MGIRENCPVFNLMKQNYPNHSRNLIFCWLSFGNSNFGRRSEVRK